jgi:hypothetical protein
LRTIGPDGAHKSGTVVLNLRARLEPRAPDARAAERIERQRRFEAGGARPG